MDDYDAFLYSIDDSEPSEEVESDNDVLDNVDEEPMHTDTAVVLVPASSPTTVERDNDDGKQPGTSSMVSKCMSKCNRFVNVHSTLRTAQPRTLGY